MDRRQSVYQRSLRKALSDALAERDAKDDALQQIDSLRVVARSEAARASDPTLAPLLAIEGGERPPLLTSAHNNALLAALPACRERRTFDGQQIIAVLAVEHAPPLIEMCV